MPPRRRPADLAADRARVELTRVVGELRRARVDRGLRQSDVARTAGLSGSRLSRIERGSVDTVSVRQLAMLLGSVGLDLSVRVFPAGQPIRDAAHAALLARLRDSLHPSLRMRTEVPLPTAGDQRAWDAVIAGPGWLMAVEAETRPGDLQALERRLSLKLRDSGFDRVLLVLRQSRHNRELVRAHAAALHDRFPLPGQRAMELLAAGVDPGAGAVVLL